MEAAGHEQGDAGDGYNIRRHKFIRIDMKKNLVISTGAGMSAESGISTFRDAGGLWENYNVMDVASAEGFARNPKLIHDFYNARRRDLVKAQPNKGHLGLVDLEKDYNVYVITQNVDDLHERAGSSHVLHLHGELMKVRAIDDEEKVWQLKPEALETSPETVIDGHRVRPHIVFFQEAVPNIVPAIERHQHGGVSRRRAAQLCTSRSAGVLHRPEPGQSARRSEGAQDDRLRRCGGAGTRAERSEG